MKNRIPLSQQASASDSSPATTPVQILSGQLGSAVSQTDWLTVRQFNFLACDVRKTFRHFLSPKVEKN